MQSGDYQYTATAKKEFIIGPQKEIRIPSGCQLPIIGEIKVYDDGKKGFTLYLQQNKMFYQPCHENAEFWDIKSIVPIVPPSGDAKNPSIT